MPGILSGMKRWLMPTLALSEMSYEESNSYFKRLETTLPVDNKYTISVAISVGNSFTFKNPKSSNTNSIGKSSKINEASNMWFHYCGKINHNTGDCRTIAKFKEQKLACLKPMVEPERSLWPSFLKK
jgi:hypothetical protein